MDSTVTHMALNLAHITDDDFLKLMACFPDIVDGDAPPALSAMKAFLLVQVATAQESWRLDTASGVEDATYDYALMLAVNALDELHYHALMYAVGRANRLDKERGIVGPFFVKARLAKVLRVPVGSRSSIRIGRPVSATVTGSTKQFVMRETRSTALPRCTFMVRWFGSTQTGRWFANSTPSNWWAGRRRSEVLERQLGRRPLHLTPAYSPRAACNRLASRSGRHRLRLDDGRPPAAALSSGQSAAPPA